MSKESSDLLHLFYQECIKEETDGFTIMEAAEDFAKTHPEVLITYCSDHNFATGCIILIPHEDDKEYHGTTFFYIPQCDLGYVPTGFLYPRKLELLTDAMKYHLKKATEKPDKYSLLSTVTRADD